MSMMDRLFGRETSPAAPAAAPTTPEEKSATLKARCYQQEGKILSMSNVLPTAGTVLALRILDLLRDVLSLTRTPDSSTLDLLQRMEQEYLPQVLDSYVLAARSGTANPALLEEQLLLLVEAVEEALEAVRTNNQRALETQGLFLQSKFGGA